MREVSDRLCLEYKLSVIEKPMNKSMQYGEWQAEREGKPTWRGLIIKDLDDTTSECVTMRQFLYRLRQKGYAIKYDAKYFTLKPPGKARYVRIDRKHPEYSRSSSTAPGQRLQRKKCFCTEALKKPVIPAVCGACTFITVLSWACFKRRKTGKQTHCRFCTGRMYERWSRSAGKPGFYVSTK